MNVEFLIAKRLGASGKKSFGKAILRLAIISIALSMTVMIIATSIVSGFKSAISSKMFGFWGHIHISKSYNSAGFGLEANPMSAMQDYYPFIDTIGQIEYIAGEEGGPRFQTKGGIRHIQTFVNKEGIIKTKDQIEGIILRGVDKDYDWEFLEKYIVEGEKINYKTRKPSKEILISTVTASRLQLKLGDSFRIYFVQDGNSLARKFKVKGIYKTGLEEYDRRFALVDIRTLQRLNNWRPYHNYGQNLVLEEENVKLMGLTHQGDEDWTFLQHRIEVGSTFDLRDSSSKSIVLERSLAEERSLTVGDSIRLRYVDEFGDNYTFRHKVVGIFSAQNTAALQQMAFVNWQSINQLNTDLAAQVSGFEIFIDKIEDLDAFGNYVNFVTLLGKDAFANTIKELQPQIFDWLSLTDMNERIILILMILVSIINMTTALIILILERTNMIGILKALGARDWSIRKIFLYNAAHIIGYGLLWGNIIGIGLCLIQQQWGLIQLPEDMYYVSVAPVALNIWTIVYLNIGTMLITLLVLILPTWLIARIDPVKAIRFS